MSDAAALQQMGVELLAEPLKNANHASKLLGAIQAPGEVTTTGDILSEALGLVDRPLAAIRALQLFFQDSLERGELRISSGQEQARGKAARSVHQEWLNRQYAAFHSNLLGLFTSASSQAVQVGALSAVLELTRAEKPGDFSAANFVEFLQTALSSNFAEPEVTSVLASRFLGYADIRYHTLRAIEKTASLAVQRASEGGKIEEEDQGQIRKETPTSRTALRLPPDAQASEQEIGRKLHTLLVQIPPLGSPAAGAAKDKLTQDVDIERPSEQADELLGLGRSWCGSAEAGRVVGSTAGEGAQRRRKRRRLEAEQGGAGKVLGDDSRKPQAAKWASALLQKRAFSQAWLALLRLPLPDDVYKKVLTRLHEDVIPNMTDPLLLADRLTGALNGGGLLGMLALHAIFVLVTKHSLEYPEFYPRLYQLLQPTAFLAKQRAKFFQLADVFLASSLVPAYTVAAFIKRFARLSLNAPPAGALVCLAFVHNLLRRHPACNVLLNRPKQPSSASNGAVSEHADVFLEDEGDPAKSRAIESSLWEVESLRNHFCPQVAVAAGQILEKDLSDRRKTAEVDIGPLVGGSYSGMVKAELNRRIKQIPTAFYQTPPTRLFDANSAPDFVGWAF